MTPSARPDQWQDPRRWIWPFALTLSLVPLFIILAYPLSGQPLLLLAPIVLGFGLVPLLDAIVGADTANPAEKEMEALSRDPFYEAVAYALIPAHFALFIGAAWLATTQAMPWWGWVGLVAGVGLINGNLINIGHELGHKGDRRNRLMAKAALSLSGYGHFTIEHNQGHHVMVSTPEDCTSARLGESVYAFGLRELPQTFANGLRRETRRLERKGHGFWHPANDIVQGWAMTLAVTTVLVLWLGWAALPFILLHHALSWIALTATNYIEHYGLLRQQRENGRYEPCQPKHSWNANQRISNILLLQLQRHSDHHAYPMRPYQSLKDHADAPSLPSGYPGCLLMAAIPPLWFAVMDPRVMAWADGRVENANLCPRAAHRYQAG
ncbi:alkane 1-monooxygenase [Parvularcula sp. LCG005]|uniref:alkane 1-monooxygenase n=1 Tax=Parvularcula sp. LCG005 TaxID=3078805 RepID=UPI002942C342|nr:alkane 1-monooxygenase [Parvularcula sp. LCG005]WOI54440.1 alkane 1-monooxygenase [Parvularcula sp. LCG005]